MRLVANGTGEFAVFAFGQVATGIVAIGQLARGGLAIGQGAIGLVAVGQGAVGVFYASGMVGVAGRKGWGIVVPLVPSVGSARAVPPSTPIAELLRDGATTSGWIRASLREDALGLGLFEGGQRVPIKIDRKLRGPSQELVKNPPAEVFAFTRREAGRLVCDRIAYVPERPWRKKGFRILWAVQVVALLGLGIAFWPLVGTELLAETKARLGAGHAEAKPAGPHGHGGRAARPAH